MIIGMSAQQRPIDALSVPAQVANAPQVVVLGGLNGNAAGIRMVRDAYDAYVNAADNFVDAVFVPVANPDAVPLLFPPNEPAYATNWTAWSLWRWLTTVPPDLVLIAGDDDYELATALMKAAAIPGSIPLRTVHGADELIAALRGKQSYAMSAARKAVEARRARSPQAVAQGLAGVYGQQLTALTYIPAMALIGRMRLGQLAEVERIVATTLDNADKVPLTSSLQIAGHLLYAELAEHTRNPRSQRYLQLARRAADLGFDANGKPKDVMPFHGDYSDAFFMETPLLAKVGKLTGEQRYFDMALNHVNYMHKELLRDDGLYNHWPKAEAAWGRGNAFASLGLALALSEIPADHAAHKRLLQLFQAHAGTLLAHVDVDGMWHNVIDIEGSWPETSATTMIATALLRGIRQGWLDPQLRELVERAWSSVAMRTDDNYGFVNVCESTVGQDSLDAYLNRKALIGRDDRQGGMLLMLVTELLVK
ncbi:MAG TPA: glycoside hydrolase family 88 protein [Candidatus Acidoferrum sp.]|nr:glycoside hydrolase family 88 protein [Candidatus Acidoferrum sp.]